MDAIGRFVGEPVIIDGIEGVIYGEHKINGWRHGEGNNNQIYNPCRAREIPISFFKDSHYRFIWAEDNAIYEKIISARGLIPAEDDTPHYKMIKEDKEYIIIPRKRSFKTRERQGGLVGRITKYEIETPAAVIKIRNENASGIKSEETLVVYPERDKTYQTIKKYEEFIKNSEKIKSEERF